jgi:hypothetical protein
VLACKSSSSTCRDPCGWCVGDEHYVGVFLGLGHLISLGRRHLMRCCQWYLALLSLYELMAVAGFGFWMGHLQKPCTSLAILDDDDVLDTVLLPGGITKKFLISRVAGFRFIAQLACLFGWARFSSPTLGSPFHLLCACRYHYCHHDCLYTVSLLVWAST